MTLGALVKDLDKRMIGVSDRFDSRDPSARWQLHFFAIFNEEAVERQRQRVRRGKMGTFLRRTLQCRPPIGITGVPAFDANGNPILGSQGRQLRRAAVDPVLRKVPELLAKRFVDDKVSISQIVKEFNRDRVAGKDYWGFKCIEKMLGNYMYVGIEIRNRDKKTVNKTTGRVKTYANPRKDWKVIRHRGVQIWSWKRWKQLQARLREVRRIGKEGSPTRNCAYPTTLLSGTLVCGYCGRELVLGRSATRGPKSKCFICINGKSGIHGCPLKGSKSVSIIEKAILKYVRSQVLTIDNLTDLVRRANEYLSQEAAKPRADTSGTKITLAELRNKRERLIQFVADGAVDDFASMKLRIRALDREIKGLEVQINRIESAGVAQVPPVDCGRTLDLLREMQDLLNADIPVAGHALRKILGVVSIRMAEDHDKTKGWIATIQADLIPLVAERAAAHQSPDAPTWNKLSTRIWSPKESIGLKARTPPYLEHMRAVMGLCNSGKTFKEIAALLGIHHAMVAKAYHRAPGQLPGRYTACRRKKEWQLGVPPQPIPPAENVCARQEDPAVSPRLAAA